TVTLDTYGVWWRHEMGRTPEEIAAYERVGMPELYFPEEIAYATAHKQREGGRVAAVTQRVVPGSQEQVEQTLAPAERSTTVSTSFVERYHGTQRQFNARKKRKAYTFSK